MDDGITELWRRHVEGDATAWPRICAELWRPIRRFFVNKVEESADELTQRTFERLMARVGGFEGRGTIRSFAFGIARNVFLEYARERRRVSTIDPEELSAAALDPRPCSVLCRRAEQRLVLEALRRLSLDHQIVIELHYWEGLSDSEIADVLELNSPHTARSRLSRARERVRELIDELEQEAPLASTSANFERWMQSVKERLAADPAPG